MMMKSFLFFLAGISVVLSACTKQDTLVAQYLKVDHKEKPYTDEVNPLLSWKLSSLERDQYQTAYQVLVASSPDKLNEDDADKWNSGKILSEKTNQIVYSGKQLSSRELCYWKVRSWDKNDKVGPWSEPANWEMALLEKDDWTASWIGFDLGHLGKGKKYHLPPVPYLRKEAEIKGKVEKARLYVTALGLYEFEINGKKVGNHQLAPGWTDYNKRVYYQVFDVSEYLNQGENALAATLSYGWYAGYIGYALLVKLPRVKAFYGEVPKLLAQMEIEYEDGSTQTIVSDGSWKATESPIYESDLLNGESYDATREISEWNKSGFDDGNWSQVDVYEQVQANLQIHPGPPVIVTDELEPKSISERPDGKYIVDLGQNFAGVVKLNVKGEAGQKIVLRFGEMLHPDGSLMTENLREARAIDTYICKGDPNGESWTPKFTFHGFQFVEISGLKYKPDNNVIKGLAFSSNTPDAGSFECSDPMVNQLVSNITWTQKANFIDIPTDCPQRDERLGWTGDAQIYISSAVMNSDVEAFFKKWIVDLNDSQWDFGAYPNFAPKPYNRAGMLYSPGWMEAGVICPYHIFKAYGNKQIIEDSWSNMERFMDFHYEKSKGKYFYPEASFEEISPKGGFADWLSIGKKTPPDLLASFYYGYCAKLMSEMAAAIGKDDKVDYYANLFDKIKHATKVHYMNDDGKFICDTAAYGIGNGYVDGQNGFSGHTQTAYANAIYMDFLTGNEKQLAGKYLAELVEANDGKLSTGFLGVKQLLPALSQTGNTQIAYQLLLNKEYPSWGFEIEQGATSIWERWNSYTKENGFVAGMNSFSHYSFGSVYEWMVEHMAGIKNKDVGYKTIQIKPEVNKSLDYVTCTYESVLGSIESSWKNTNKSLEMIIEVPVNAVAEVHLPADDLSLVTENNSQLSEKTDGVRSIKITDKSIVVTIGSGRYNFSIQNK